MRVAVLKVYMLLSLANQETAINRWSIPRIIRYEVYVDQVKKKDLNSPAIDLGNLPTVLCGNSTGNFLWYSF